MSRRFQYFCNWKLGESYIFIIHIDISSTSSFITFVGMRGNLCISPEICMLMATGISLVLRSFMFLCFTNFYPYETDVLLIFYLHAASPLILTFIQIVLYRKSLVFWDITPRNQLKVNRSFRGTFLLHFNGRNINQLRNQHEAGNKHGFHGAIFHKRTIGGHHWEKLKSYLPYISYLHKLRKINAYLVGRVYLSVHMFNLRNHTGHI